MKKFSYFMKTASGDSYHAVLNKKYDDPIDFMKNEMPWEFEAWGDDEPDYEEFSVREVK